MVSGIIMGFDVNMMHVIMGLPWAACCHGKNAWQGDAGTRHSRVISSLPCVPDGLLGLPTTDEASDLYRFEGLDFFLCDLGYIYVCMYST